MNDKSLDLEYFDSNCFLDDDPLFNLSPTASFDNLASPISFFQSLDVDVKSLQLPDDAATDFLVNNFLHVKEENGLSSSEDMSVPSTLLSSRNSNSGTQSPNTLFLSNNGIKEEVIFESHQGPSVQSLPSTHQLISDKSHQSHHSAFSSVGGRCHQPTGVMSGRVKKREFIPQVIHIKRSPNPSIAFNYVEPNSFSTASTQPSSLSLSKPATFLGQTHQPPSLPDSTTNFLSTSSSKFPWNTNSHAVERPSLLKSYYSDAGSSASDEEDSSVSTNLNYSFPTSVSHHHHLKHHNQVNTRTGNLNGAVMLHSLNGASSTLPMITEEEMRVMANEGYTIPNLAFPLSKSDEKNLKKVRRKIKNKLSAQESRKKKKEYLEKLERQADSLNQENMSLKRRLEDVERRLEMVEVRNRQLLSRLSKVGSTGNGNGVVFEPSLEEMSSNVAPSSSSLRVSSSSSFSSRAHGPPSFSTTRVGTGSGPGNPGNSTKFYIMAFVLLFSVLFAGDPSLMVMRPGAPPTFVSFPTTLVMGPASHSARGMGLALFSYSPYLSRARSPPHYFRAADVFCPAGVHLCHRVAGRNAPHGVRFARTFSNGSTHSSGANSVGNGNMSRDLVETSLTASSAGRKFVPSVLLDVQDTTLESCSMRKFWQFCWKCVRPSVQASESRPRLLDEDETWSVTERVPSNHTRGAIQSTSVLQPLVAAISHHLPLVTFMSGR